MWCWSRAFPCCLPARSGASPDQWPDTGEQRRRAHAPNGQAAWRVILRAGAGLFLVVAATLVVVVIPAVARDTSPHATPGPAVKAFIVSVVLHGFLAAFMLWRTRGGKLPVVAGVFGLLLGLLLLAPAAGFAHHGPAMHPAAIALWACTGIDFVVGACVFGGGGDGAGTRIARRGATVSLTNTTGRPARRLASSGRGAKDNNCRPGCGPGTRRGGGSRGGRIR